MPDASDPDVRARLREIGAQRGEAHAEREALKARAAAGDTEALAALEKERAQALAAYEEESAKLNLAQPRSRRLTADEAVVRMLKQPPPTPLKTIDVEALARRWAEATQPPPPSLRQRLWKWSKTAASVTGWVLGALAALRALGVI